jgi:signal transduction histidine kinase/ActR/RegA family two-component response regulator
LELLVNPAEMLPPLISFVVLIVLFFLTLRAARHNFGIQLFCGMLLSSAIWSLLVLFMRASTSTVQALMWEKLIFALYCLSSVLFYHFTVVYTKTKDQKPLLVAVYLLLAAVVILSHFNLIIVDMSQDSGRYTLIMSPASYFFAAVNIIMMCLGVYNLLKKYKYSSSYDERNQLLYLSGALFFPLAGALIDAFTDLHPTAIWGNLIFCLICSLAVIRHHLFNISLIIKKSLTYLVINAILALPYSVIILIVYEIYKKLDVTWWVYLVLVPIFTFTLRPFYNWIAKIIDRMFYREKYDLLKTIEKFDVESQNIDNLETLGITICVLVKTVVQCRHVFLLTPSRDGDGLVVRSSDSPDYRESAFLDMDGMLVTWLRSHLNLVFPDDLEKLSDLKSVSNTERAWLEKLEAALIVPIKGRGDALTGALILEQKMSGQPYSSEDKKMLTNLANHVGVKLENARLYRDSIQTREDLKTWLNSMSDSVVIISPESTIQYMNTTARNKFGDFTGKTCWQALGREIKCTLCPVRELDHNMPAYNQIVKVGNRFYDAAYGPFLGPDGKQSVIEVLRDITERRKMENEKREFERKAQVASRLATVGELSAGIAHEINNPLTAVVGYAELLSQRDDLPADIKSDLSTINEGARRVANILRRLLLFSRQSRPMRDLISVGDLLQTTLELRAYQLKNSNIKVIKNIDKDVPRILADGGQLQQVFLNLIANAESEMYTANGKGVLVLKVEKKESSLLISFQDDGPGISEENMQKLFQPFFTTKPFGKGTGLGLSICHGIISEHNGRIWAESQPGKGATFFLEIPLISKDDLQSNDARDGIVGELPASRILLVDDEIEVRQYLTRVLEGKGHKVNAVGNVKEALANLQDTTYDLILLDLRMPDISGWEFYGQLKNMDERTAKKIIFITGDLMDPETEKLLGYENLSYVIKPIDMNQLFREMKKALERVSNK